MQDLLTLNGPRRTVWQQHCQFSVARTRHDLWCDCRYRVLRIISHPSLSPCFPIRRLLPGVGPATKHSNILSGNCSYPEVDDTQYQSSPAPSIHPNSTSISLVKYPNAVPFCIWFCVSGKSGDTSNTFHCWTHLRSVSLGEVFEVAMLHLSNLPSLGFLPFEWSSTPISAQRGHRHSCRIKY